MNFAKAYEKSNGKNVNCLLYLLHLLQRKKSFWILVVPLKSAPRYRTCQYLFLFFKISFLNKPRIHQSISKAQIFQNHGLKFLWYHKKVSLKVLRLCKCRNKWCIRLENSHFCVDYPVTLHNGTFDQLATKGTTFPKT